MASSYTVPPSSFLPPCSPEVTPSNAIAQQIADHLHQLDTQAHDIIAEMQRLHGLKANLDMLHFGQQFSELMKGSSAAKRSIKKGLKARDVHMRKATVLDGSSGAEQVLEE